LLDIGGGTGIYSIGLVKTHPQLKAVVFDRPEVLKCAEEFITKHKVDDRVMLKPGDMFQDVYPGDVDVVLLSNILHDWDVPECKQLINRCAGALPKGGKLLIHDVLLDDDLGGPLPIALYSASLFSFTEGRAYSHAEYASWLEETGFIIKETISTAAHCHVICAVKK
jgi:cyclopropane fatty-acyl-phospholipid synthase-like methyltransferase